MLPDDATVRSLLTRARTIAVVGLSEKPARDSHAIARYLQAQGYRVVPVNPNVREVLGEPAYPALGDVPDDVRIDLVDVFRRSAEVPPIVAAAIDRHVPALWMQLGVVHPAAAAAAAAAGITTIEDECIMVQHRRLRIPPIARN